MKKSKFVPVFVALLSSTFLGFSKEFFTSPSGKTDAIGSIADPLDFATAISAVTSPVRAGDTLWVRGGVYTAPIPGFTFNVHGTPNRPVRFRNYHNERAIVDGTFKAHGEYVYYWGLEFTDQTTPYLPMSLTRSEKESLMLNGNYSFCSFYLEAAPSSKFINNVFHDTFGQIEYGISSSNSVFYGNVVLNLGEQCLDNERGVGIYTQNREGTRELTDNIVAQNILNGIDVWSSGDSFINNYTLDGNICFNNGYGRIQSGHNMLIGAGNGCTNLLLVSNVLYYPVNTDNRANLIVGHGGQSYAPRIYGTLAINGGFELAENFGQMEFTGNELLSTAAWNNHYVVWPRDYRATSYIFDNNKYYGSPLMEISAWVTNASYPLGDYIRTQTPSGWQGWQRLGQSFLSVGSAFRPDAHSLYTSQPPSGTRVIVRPNRYESGRANIAILNFDLTDTVEVDLSVLGLPLNTAYELHPVQNLYNQTNTGNYTGVPIRVPMTGWNVRQPQSRNQDLASTFPQFGAFLFIARGTATPATQPPVILSTIPAQTIPMNGSGSTYLILLKDPDTAESALTVTVTSSNPTLLPTTGLILGGFSFFRTLQIVPAIGVEGSSAVTILVSDGVNTTTQSFQVTVSEGAIPSPLPGGPIT